MLANVLAVLLGLGSLVFYLVAFLYPEVHRRSDFVWSGLGLLYSIDLWFSAEQMAPAVLLGQGVVVALLAGLGWQTLTVRREKTPVYQQTPIVLTPEVVGDWAKSTLNQLRIAPVETVRPATLKDRPLTGASTERLRQGLNQSLDPRRRPLYDYEFVEDGILENAPEEVLEMSLDELETVVSGSEQIDPSFAIAEVIAIQTGESSQPESPQSETGDFKETETIAVESATSENETTEVKENSDIVSITSKPVLEKASETVPEPVLGSAVIDEDWDDEPELEEPEPVNTQTTGSRIATSKPSQKQPSLLAMPVILLGWLKDVAQSLIKPRPSKPVIDIPRREPSLPIADNQPIEDSDDDSNWFD